MPSLASRQTPAQTTSRLRTGVLLVVFIRTPTRILERPHISETSPKRMTRSATIHHVLITTSPCHEKASPRPISV